MRHAGLVRSRARVTVLARHNLVVRRINVAISARGVVVWDAEISMGEDRTKPGGGHVSGMAGRGRGRVIRRHMVWHGRSVSLRVRVIGLMAGGVTVTRRQIIRGVVA